MFQKKREDIWLTILFVLVLLFTLIGGLITGCVPINNPTQQNTKAANKSTATQIVPASEKITDTPLVNTPAPPTLAPTANPTASLEQIADKFYVNDQKIELLDKSGKEIPCVFGTDGFYKCNIPNAGYGSLRYEINTNLAEEDLQRLLEKAEILIFRYDAKGNYDKPLSMAKANASSNFVSTDLSLDVRVSSFYIKFVYDDGMLDDFKVYMKPLSSTTIINGTAVPDGNDDKEKSDGKSGGSGEQDVPEPPPDWTPEG